MKTLAAMLCCLLLAACSASYKPGVAVQAAQLRAALDNRHGFHLVTHDTVYRTTTLDALWQAGTDSWYPTKGEMGDCDDRAQALLVQLRRNAAMHGDSLEPAAFLMPSLMRDGRRHAVIVALTETSHGAEWVYWDPLENRQLGRSEILRPLSTL